MFTVDTINETWVACCCCWCGTSPRLPMIIYTVLCVGNHHIFSVLLEKYDDYFLLTHYNRCWDYWVLRCRIFCSYGCTYFTIAASFLMKHSIIHLFFVIRIGQVQSQRKVTTNSQSSQHLDLNTCINTYTSSYHKKPHFMQPPAAFPMYTLAPYFPTRGVFIIGNCFSITTNAQTSANKGIYE